MSNDYERELDWEDQISNDSPDFIILPEGDYDFEVLSYERARHPGSDKLPACGKAIVHIRIDSPKGSTTIKHNLFLHTKTEGMLCAFFTAIGLRKKGEQFAMDWNAVAGKRGRCQLGIREWTKDNGDTSKFNEVKRFYEPEVSSKPSGKFKPGEF